MFRTILDRERIYTPVGSRIVEEYEIDTLEDVDKIKKTGEYNLYDKIQSFRSSCDLRSIIDRYLKTGDESILDRARGIYMDVVGLPKERTDWLRQFQEANDMFDRLPVDIRSAFDNDSRQFFIKMGTKEFNEILNRSNKKDVTEENTKEEKDNE